MVLDKYFLEVEYSQIYKHKNNVPGDVFISSKSEDEKIISVLSDGLGSGIKANVLATLSATMASQFIKNNIDIRKSARIIIDTLPVCNIRKIGYSTFTVSEIDNSGNVRVIEYDNPCFLYFKNGVYQKIAADTFTIGNSGYKNENINYYNFSINSGDRLIFFSDGVTQSGMGKDQTPLGWGEDNLVGYLQKIFQETPDISARDLSKKIVTKSLQNDDQHAHDDITCGVIYCRKPRKLLIVTGPSVHKANDKIIADMITNFDGKKIISGGTTAMIVARETGLPVEVDLASTRGDVPPEAKMEGIDLVTEGILTLCKVTKILEEGHTNYRFEESAATKMVDIMLNTDIIQFIVGTKINEVHQDPNMPVEIEIRRNIVRKIMKLLEKKYLKQTELQFI